MKTNAGWILLLFLGTSCGSDPPAGSGGAGGAGGSAGSAGTGGSRPGGGGAGVAGSGMSGSGVSGSGVGGSGMGVSPRPTSCPRQVTRCSNGMETTYTCDPCASPFSVDCDMPDGHTSCGGGKCVSGGLACPSTGPTILGQACSAMQPCPAGADCLGFAGDGSGFCSPACSFADSSACATPGPGQGACAISGTPGASTADHCAIVCDPAASPPCPAGASCRSAPTFFGGGMICIPDVGAGGASGAGGAGAGGSG